MQMQLLDFVKVKKRPLKRVYYPYQDWEDYLHEMYEDKSNPVLVEAAVSLLSNQDRLLWAMRRVIREWLRSAEMNMSNRSRNRQAWLGQAACCLDCGVPENLTKQAWNELSEEVREKANAIADIVIGEWEDSYFRQ